jgi:hypothetical protein
MRRIDAIHLALMCLALALAYLVPFELLLLSYVVLGPAHYLTEISWLHDRKYFLPHASIPLVLAVISAGAAFITDGYWFGVLFWATFVVCALFAAATTAMQALVLFVGAGVVTVFVLAPGSNFILLGTLLPTLIHVSLFTLVFMLVGAWRAGSMAQALLVVVYLAAIALIAIVPPSAATAIPAFADTARDYFGGVAPALGQVIGVPQLKLDGRMTGLLAFIYSYHYLNWFIKAEVTRWSDMPKARMALIAAASAACTGLYFYDYALGFVVLLALSLLHVVLEFPLNTISLRQLGSIAGQVAARRVRRQQA